MTSAVTERPLSAWERLLSPPDTEMSVEDARYILRRNFPPADHARMAVLGEKASAGTLTPAETEELDEFIHVGLQLTRLQALARIALRRHAAGE